jgi:hypothetical protein
MVSPGFVFWTTEHTPIPEVRFTPSREVAKKRARSSWRLCVRMGLETVR